MWTDGQTDMARPIFCFRNFAKESKSLRENKIVCLLDCILDLEKKAVKF
jgi:hypothetical protein